MCGIIGAFLLKEAESAVRPKVLEMARRIRHRGPDWSGIFSSPDVFLAHERLSIIDPKSGNQPLYNEEGSVAVIANGEIYNFKELKNLTPNYNYRTDSDSEVILALYLTFGSDFMERLNGIFAFVIYDSRDKSFLIARDHMGIIPLYYGSDSLGQLFIASELKALEDVCQQIEQFPPGHYLHNTTSLRPISWYSRSWQNAPTLTSDLTDILPALELAVSRQLMCDVPFGVLLSGGLDSSIIASIAKKILDQRDQASYSRSKTVLHSFAIGLEGSPDLLAARKAADFIGTYHHEIHFTVQEGLDALQDVIYHLETYDVTTVRASTPMFLLARAIKSRGIKMVLSGEGADELFGGYLYFHKAPNALAFHEETVRKLSKLHQYDCLRANKALMAWGVEGRVPFLDKEFMDVAMRLDPKDKMIRDGRIEKWALRQAFEGYLPDSILWRQKEQFSDGVGYGWIDTLKAYAEKEVSDKAFSYAAMTFPIQTPHTKEEYYYRSIFENYYPSTVAVLTVPSVKSVACSTPEAIAWDDSFQGLNDPSGRAVKNVHQEAYFI